MNYQDPNLPGGSKAEVLYLDSEFKIVKPGQFVLCVVTGQRIPLEDLRYWNVEKQVAYCSAAAAHKDHQASVEGPKE